MKLADFGIARIQNHEGVMTAETGTYRWMAPEVLFTFKMLYFLIQYQMINSDFRLFSFWLGIDLDLYANFELVNVLGPFLI